MIWSNIGKKQWVKCEKGYIREIDYLLDNFNRVDDLKNNSSRKNEANETSKNADEYLICNEGCKLKLNTLSKDEEIKIKKLMWKVKSNGEIKCSICLRVLKDEDIIILNPNLDQFLCIDCCKKNER